MVSIGGNEGDGGKDVALARVRVRRLLLWLAVFIFLYITFLIAENAIGDNFHKCVTGETAYYNKANQANFNLALSFWVQNVCSLSLVDRHNGVFALFGTIAVACFTWTLWRSTDKLWQAGERTAERQLRAYVHVDHAIFQNDNSGQCITTGWVDAKIKNYGATPASNFVFRSESKIGKKEDESILLKLSKDAFWQAGATIPPGATFSLKLPVARQSLGFGEWQLLTSQGHAAYIWGHMTYTDAFKRDRHTNFQMICRFGEITSFTFCEKGNDAT